MKIKVLHDYKSPNKSTRNAKRIELVVVHSTAGRFPGCASWLCDKTSKVSAHYLIARDGRIFELVDESFSAWHAGKSSFDFNGDGKIVSEEKAINQRSIGIELEYTRGDYPEEQTSALRDLVLNILSRYSLEPDRVVGHREIAPGRKTDPVNFDLDKFRRLLNERT